MDRARRAGRSSLAGPLAEALTPWLAASERQLTAVLAGDSYSTQPAMSVISQSPSPDVNVPAGSSIEVVVSRGAEKTIVDPVVGTTAAEAQAKLEAAGFIVGQSEEWNSQVSAGRVVSQQPDGGAVPVGAAPLRPTRRKAVAVLLLVEAGILAALWVGQSLAFVLTGRLPQLVEDTGGGIHLIASLDLTLIVPVLVLGAVLLWRDRAWGRVVGAGVLVQCVLITVDLFITPAFQAAAGVGDAWAAVPLFAATGVGFVAGAFILLRSAPVAKGSVGRSPSVSYS
jgi:hypothetical protein